jgi:hypothetical protein
MEKEKLIRLLKKDSTILVMLLFITLVFRIWTVMMIHTGIDERDYWYSAKAISQGFSYPYINHRTVRWGVIIPVAIQQLVTGIGPNSYYVMPILNALAQTMLLFFLGKRLFNRRVGALASLLLVFFPYQIRSASQIRPEVFSVTYILLFLFFFHTYLSNDNRKKALRYLVISSIILFIAYLTKITTLFFMPAAFILIGIYRKKYFFRDSLLFGGVLLVLFLSETLAYNLAGEYPLGQLSVILSNHVADMDVLGSYVEVLKRYSLENLQLYWQLPIWLFFAFSTHALIKRRDMNTVYLAICGITFIFFVTFTPSSLHPLKMAEPFVNRYFSAALPCIFLVLASYADSVLFRFRICKKFYNAFVPIGCVGMILFCIVFSLPIVPQKIRAYIHSPFDQDYHPFNLNRSYVAELNKAAQSGIPIVAIDSNGGNNALYTASWYFLDRLSYIDGRAPSPSFSFEKDGCRYNSLGGQLIKDNGEALAVIRDPFRIRMIRSENISGLDSDLFPEQQ